MQQQNVPVNQQEKNNLNLEAIKVNLTDFDLRIDSNNVETIKQSPTKFNGQVNSKKKKDIKNEMQTDIQDGSISTPAKLTGKRRRSSQKSNDVSSLANTTGNGLDTGLIMIMTIFTNFLKTLDSYGMLNHWC